MGAHAPINTTISAMLVDCFFMMVPRWNLTLRISPFRIRRTSRTTPHANSTRKSAFGTRGLNVFASRIFQPETHSDVAYLLEAKALLPGAIDLGWPRRGPRGCQLPTREREWAPPRLGSTPCPARWAGRRSPA